MQDSIWKILLAIVAVAALAAGVLYGRAFFRSAPASAEAGAITSGNRAGLVDENALIAANAEPTYRAAHAPAAARPRAEPATRAAVEDEPRVRRDDDADSDDDSRDEPAADDEEDAHSGK